MERGCYLSGYGKISSKLDKALLALRLVEDDEPFDLPDLPEYCSSERNVLSLVGRVLNPECQSKSNLNIGYAQEVAIV